MSKYEDVIIRHEEARQLVAKLDKERKELVNQCANQSIIGNCFTEAHATLNEWLDCGNEYNYTFSECLLELIYDGDGACENCRKAQEIKRGSLANAKKEFGNAKRSLSKYGRILIQERTHTVKE